MSREIDVRDFSTSVMTPDRADELHAQAQQASAALPGMHTVRIARFDQTTGNAAEVVSEGAPSADGDYISRALAHVQTIGGALGLTAVAPEFVPDPHVPETSSGGHVVNLQQRFSGIPVFQAATMVRFGTDGAIVDTVGSTVNLKAKSSAEPQIPVEEAVKRAAAFVTEPDDDQQVDQFGEPLRAEPIDVSNFEPKLIAMATTTPERNAVLTTGPFDREIVASLIWFPLADGLELAWRVRLTFPGAYQAYEVLVDAGQTDGRILFSHQQVATAVSGDVYRVDPSAGRQLTSFPRLLEEYQTGNPSVGQHGWRWCKKCQGLYFGDHPTQGTCPAGGAHDKSSSGDYHVDDAPGASGQHGWRFCSKCEGMFFAGNATNGICPAGGAHDPNASGDYAIRGDVPLALGQNGWRWCSQCQGMWFSGNGVPGFCPSGGGHNSAGSGDYRLSHGGPDLPAPFPREWVTATGTQGNTTNAHLGVTGVPIQGTQGNGDVKFDPADATGDDQKVLNIFYYCCVMHDLFYVLGFREADGNYQVDNFGLGGVAGDRLDARSHPGAVVGTANMAHTVDGDVPIMNMGLVTSTGRHTAFDSSVVFHEFTHGVSDRLVGGGLNTHNLDSPQSGGMGEGWSDYTPCTLNNTVIVGNWVVNNTAGIRGFPYDSNFPDDFGDLGTGRYTEVHNIGEIWCATLIECNRRTEPRTMMQLVVDGFKLTPANPSMPQARDAILLALDQMLSGGRISPDQHAALWQGVWGAFVKFGMGPRASSIGAMLTGIVADFSLGQRNWRWCQKCEGMFFAGNPSQGTCPAGGAHDRSASGDYDMIVPVPGMRVPPGQTGWRWCQKCQGMFFGDNPSNGSCPVGGAHDKSASGPYKLIHQAPAAHGQHDWRWCNKCQGLFFNGHPTQGTCPAGGAHDASTSGDYSILVW